MMLKQFDILFRNGGFSKFRYFSNILKPMNVNNSIMSLVKTKINLSGPLSVAEYMKIVLTSHSGYYMINDVFGQKGDFVTSPELSQLFGEMVGVWIVNELLKLGSPKPVKLVELGPGRGTMTHDILRVLKKLYPTSNISIHLVELSPTLSQIQSEKLCQSSAEVKNKNFYREGITFDGMKIYWYKTVMSVPKEGFTCLVANEFFDALPIHKLHKTENGWREILIDLDENSLQPKLKFVISKSPTPASMLFNQANEERDHFEFCPEAGVIMEHIADRFEEHGGIALIVDYGHFGDKTDTFRAFKDHKLHDPLIDPGTADLTADVDFSFLKKSVKEKLITFGPIDQADFLSKLHIETRLKVLVDNCKSEEEKNILLGSFDMIMNKTKMGQRFKVMSFFPAVLNNLFKKYPVQGF